MLVGLSSTFQQQVHTQLEMLTSTSRNSLPPQQCYSIDVLTCGFGGFDSTPAATTDVTVFDSTTNKSTNGVRKQNKRAYHAAVTIGNNAIIVAGGTANDALINLCEQFTLSTQKWTSIAPVPIATEQMAFVVLDTKMYIF